MAHSLPAPAAAVAVLAVSMLAGVPRDVAAASLLLREGQQHLRGNALKAGIKMDFPYYHTSSELSEELRRLAKECQGATLKVHTVEEGDVKIDVAHLVRDPAPTNPVRNRVFFVSGEHAREMIGPETNLRFLQMMCGDDKSGASASMLEKSSVLAADVLDDAEFQIVLNANPLSRLKVEEGNYCVRENPNGVDLNRNWDERWEERMTLKTERGAQPFSEPETRLVKKLIEDFKPTTFLSIHSGTLGLYMPWAWSVNRLASRNQPDMMRVLKSVDKKHCRCPYGAAGKEVGYPCPGTSVDWVYDQGHASYSFAFEVWTDHVSDLRQRWSEKLNRGGASLLEKGHHLGSSHFREVFANRRSDFVTHGQVNRSSNFVGFTQIDANTSREQTARACWNMYNPFDEAHFNSTVDNWGTAFMEMSRMITLVLKKNATA